MSSIGILCCYDFWIEFNANICSCPIPLITIILLFVNGLSICFEMLFRCGNFPPSHFPLLILFPKIFYFSAHNGVSAVDRNPDSELRLIRSTHYDAYTYIIIAFCFVCNAFISSMCKM